jgi:hypothetical protein
MENINSEQISIQIIKAFKLDEKRKGQFTRYIKRLRNNKNIQGQIDKFGDQILNQLIDRQWPYISGKEIDEKQKLCNKINSLLKSNWFLNRRFRELKLPFKPYEFTNELTYRKEKREASLIEWIIGIIYLTTLEEWGNPKICQCDFCKKYGRSTSHAMNLTEIKIKKIILEITHKGNEEEFERTLGEFEMHQLLKKGRE